MEGFLVRERMKLFLRLLISDLIANFDALGCTTYDIL